MMYPEDVKALLKSLSDTQKVIAEISRTLNLQAHLFALYLAADEGPESMIGPKLSDICAELAKQGQYMNGGKS
jgi:hypothetical protein